MELGDRSQKNVSQLTGQHLQEAACGSEPSQPSLRKRVWSASENKMYMYHLVGCEVYHPGNPLPSDSVNLEDGLPLASKPNGLPRSGLYLLPNGRIAYAVWHDFSPLNMPVPPGKSEDEGTWVGPCVTSLQMMIFPWTFWVWLDKNAQEAKRGKHTLTPNGRSLQQEF